MAAFYAGPRPRGLDRFDSVFLSQVSVKAVRALARCYQTKWSASPSKRPSARGVESTACGRYAHAQQDSRVVVAAILAAMAGCPRSRRRPSPATCHLPRPSSTSSMPRRCPAWRSARRGDVLALLPRRDLPSIAEVSKPMLRLAGLRINPRTTGRTGHLREPPSCCARSPPARSGKSKCRPARASAAFTFSPDGKRFSFTNTRETRASIFTWAMSPPCKRGWSRAR